MGSPSSRYRAQRPCVNAFVMNLTLLLSLTHLSASLRASSVPGLVLGVKAQGVRSEGTPTVKKWPDGVEARQGSGDVREGWCQTRRRQNRRRLWNILKQMMVKTIAVWMARKGRRARQRIKETGLADALGAKTPGKRRVSLSSLSKASLSVSTKEIYKKTMKMTRSLISARPLHFCKSADLWLLLAWADLGHSSWLPGGEGRTVWYIT